MRIAHGRFAGASSTQRGENFSGRVWADPVLRPEDGVVINNVVFEPGGRTHWHTHEVAQILHVTHGEGWLQLADGTGTVLHAGDVVHIPADEVHWHGATPTTLVVHLAVSVGKTEWMHAVSDEDYAAVFVHEGGPGRA